MADERIEVEYIATQQQVLQAFEKLNRKMDATEKKLEKTGTTSKKAAKLAEGSFAALEKELKDNEAALKRMAMGTKEFEAQRAKVDRLRRTLQGARGDIGGMNAQATVMSSTVDRFTTAITGSVGAIVSAGAIVRSLKTDLEAIRTARENERLAEVNFGQAMAARTISNLGEGEKEAVKPLALALSTELGLPAGGVVEALGTLRSSGAESIIEAGSFLSEAAKAFPQDLANAVAVSQAALIEARATGNRDAMQVIGSLAASQAVSQTTSLQDFAEAFSANTAAGVNVYGVSAERAREEASIFSILEPSSAAEAATAQKAFFQQISQFVPQESMKLKTGGESTLTPETIQQFIGADFIGRQQQLENNTQLQEQFFDTLTRTGRNAIIRRLKPSAEDTATIDLVQKAIGSDADNAKALATQQQLAQTQAAFAITQGQRLAQVEAKQIRGAESGAISAELQKTVESAETFRRARTGGSALGMMEDLGYHIERIMSGADTQEMLRNRLEFLANARTETPENREFARQQLDRIEKLENQLIMLNESNARGNELLSKMLGQRVGAGGAAAVRPQEAPLPAATVP